MNCRILLGNTKVADKFGDILGMLMGMLYSRDGKKIKTIVGLVDHDELSKPLDSQLLPGIPRDSRATILNQRGAGAM